MAVPKEWLAFLREQFPEGSRIKLREMNSGADAPPPGSMGTLDRITDDGGFCVTWKDGRHTELALGTDSFSVLTPELQTLKLYMPLTADMYAYNDYGDLEDEPTELNGRYLTGYEGLIAAALQKNYMPEESERGIMHWYGEDDSVNTKVHSVFFRVEKRERQLWGVAECRIAGALTQEELTTLKDHIGGQASDGWGEGFEQREIKLDDGELYVHLWNSENWSIQTEQERFGPKLAEGLPELCFSVLPGTGELICIKRGESGYYPSDWSTSDAERNRELADYNNERLGVTPAQRMAMETGSMHGWSAPGADPKAYEQARPEQQQGGMTFG